MTIETDHRGMGSYPENQEFAAFLRRRKITGTFWHVVFFLATMLGLLVLVVLVLDVANDAFGYVAIENAVEPEALVRDYYKDKMLNAPTTLSSEDDNLLANGIAARPNAVGFFGYSYYKNNADRLTLLPVDGVEPSAETIESGEYSLARPLYLYTTQDLMREKPQVAGFLGYYLNNVNDFVGDVGYFEIGPSTQEQNLEAWQSATGLTDSTAQNLDPAAGDILVVGSSTVAPLTGRMADEFAASGNYAGQVQVESIGTDAGIRLFCVEGTGDILDASRSMVSIDRSACQKQLRYPIEFRVANDGLPVVVSSENDFLTGVTTEQLRQIFTTAEQWSDVDPAWPDQPIFRFIPGADSGTLDFFVAQLFGTDLATQPARNADGIAEHLCVGRPSQRIGSGPTVGRAFPGITA